jgi:hypothetical protein
MDEPTAILYLGGSRETLRALIKWGYLVRWQNGHRAVRYLRRDIDTALAAKGADDARTATKA